MLHVLVLGMQITKHVLGAACVQDDGVSLDLEHEEPPEDIMPVTSKAAAPLIDPANADTLVEEQPSPLPATLDEQIRLIEPLVSKDACCRHAVAWE